MVFSIVAHNIYCIVIVLLVSSAKKLTYEYRLLGKSETVRVVHLHILSYTYQSFILISLSLTLFDSGLSQSHSFYSCHSQSSLTSSCGRLVTLFLFHSP